MVKIKINTFLHEKGNFFKKGGTMTWANDMQCFKERLSAIIIVIIISMMMMMMMMMMIMIV